MLGDIVRDYHMGAAAVQPSLKAYATLGGSVIVGLFLLPPWGFYVLVVAVVAWVTHRNATFRRSPFQRVSLHVGGVVHRKLVFRRTILFAEVGDVFIDVEPVDGPFRFTGVRLGDRSGQIREIDVAWLEPAARSQLMEAILRECSLRHLESVRDGWSSGKRVEFGPIALDRAGVSIFVPARGGRVEIQWADLHYVRAAASGFLFGDRSHKIHIVPVGTVLHPTLLIQLLKDRGVWHDEAWPPPIKLLD